MFLKNSKLKLNFRILLSVVVELVDKTMIK